MIYLCGTVGSREDIMGRAGSWRESDGWSCRPEPRGALSTVYTLGHSNHPVARLVDLLTAHGVEAVADVRSHPYSRFSPQFRRDALRGHLEAAGIDYLFLGRELGARSADPACYVDGKVCYDLLARTVEFTRGLERVIDDARRRRLALLCAEKDPLTCHRAILICRHLAAAGVAAQHIHADGRLESHHDALTRLLDELGIDGGDLFGREDALEQAYRRRGERIAYTKK